MSICDKSKAYSDALFEISKMSSMISNKERAKLWTKSRFSRCERFKSLSRVSSVIPMIPFIGVLHVMSISIADPPHR